MKQLLDDLHYQDISYDVVSSKDAIDAMVFDFEEQAIEKRLREG